MSKINPLIDMSKINPLIGMSKINPLIDLDKLIQVDTSKILGPFDVTKMFGTINTQFDGLNRSFAASLARIKPPIIDTGAMGKLVAQLNASRPQILTGFDPKYFKEIAEQLLKVQPVNFREHRLTDQLRLIKMSVRHRFGTVESLPSAVIQSLLDAFTSPEIDIDFLLADSSNVIVDYCFERATNVIESGSGPLVGYAVLIVEACKALSAGHDSSSQTLSTAIWDSSLTETFGRKMYKQVKKSHGNSTEIDLENKDRNATMTEIYRKAAQFPAVSAYPSCANQARYSRNTTIHHAAPKQFNRTNAVKALTIACGVITFSARRR